MFQRTSNYLRSGITRACLLAGVMALYGTVATAQTTPATAVEGKIFTSVSEMPQPSVDISKYLADNLHYPATARSAGIEGRVVAQFVINKEGKVGNIVIQRGIHPDCDREVLRVLSAMPDWKPGREAGVPVNVYYTMPVSFKLAIPAREQEATAKAEAPDDSKTYTAVEQMPRPSVDLAQYLAENLRYPESARKAGVEGRVVAQFIVDKEGKVKNIVIWRGIHPDCDQEVVRILSNMPDWIPGRQGGVAANVYYTLSVSFRLEQKEAPAPQTARLADLKLHPNPVTDEVKFYLRAEKEETAAVYIHDMNGRTLIQQRLKLQASTGETLFRIRVDRLPEGNYVLEVQQGGQKTSGKFVIRR